jgi:hypothetical protein
VDNFCTPEGPRQGHRLQRCLCRYRHRSEQLRWVRNRLPVGGQVHDWDL